MIMYCICIGRNIPAGKGLQHNNNNCVLYLYWTEYSGRKVYTTQQRMNVYCICIGRNIPAGKWLQNKHIVFVFDGKFRPESEYNTLKTINVYYICIGRNIPAGK